MTSISKLLEFFVSVPTVSGHESEYSRRICDYLTALGAQATVDNVGNILLHKGAQEENAKKILLDAHIDQIGFLVSSVEDGGFLRLAHIGGIDARTLPATDCSVIAKDGDIGGVFASTPPHLSTGADTLKDTNEIFVDTGLDTATARKLIRVGDAVVYERRITHLKNNRIAAPALDNKLCAAAITAAVLDIEEPRYDIYLCLSVREEGGGFAGMRTAVSSIKPDIIIAFDANFAKAPGVKECESVQLGRGPSISLSALTSRALTDELTETAEKLGLPLQRVVEASSLGTNGNVAEMCGDSAIAANISLPLANMHSPSELASLDDAESLRHLILSYLGVSK